jgi:tRNA pseudouridine32 synthase/23S rRNA pseudouridine746 synthase
VTLEILFQSNHLIIINKPAGLPVHPGRRSEVSVEDFFPLWRRGDDGPWLVHRLDADTAGCLVIARRKSTLIALQSAFAKGQADKTYWAIVKDIPRQDHGIINLPLLKHNTPRGWKIIVDPKGQPAFTAWRRLETAAGHALLELKPRTGRTHQIRVHCAAMDHPILGDSVYGESGPSLSLLARHIALPLDPPVTATASLPPHMREAMKRLGFAPHRKDA